MKFIKLFSIFVLTLVLLYVVGPSPKTPEYSNELPTIGTPLADIEDSLVLFESENNIESCAYTEIQWADSIRQTEYVFLYLHGFSATKHEGDSLRYLLPKRFAMNAVYNRMAGHGIMEPDTSKLVGFTAQRAWDKSLYDFQLAKKLGKKIIIGSCSTGSPIALRLSAMFPEEIAGIVNYSPNMGLPDPTTPLLNGPWGFELVQLMFGESYRTVPPREDRLILPCKAEVYTWKSVIQMQHLIETIVDRKLLGSIQVPVMNMVWYEDEANQDFVIDVEKARVMHQQLGTTNKFWVETSAREHVVQNYLLSSDLDNVYEHTYKFIERCLK